MSFVTNGLVHRRIVREAYASMLGFILQLLKLYFSADCLSRPLKVLNEQLVRGTLMGWGLSETAIDTGEGGEHL